MKAIRTVTKDKLKFFEVAPNVYAAIPPNRGLSWANAAFITKGKGLVYDTFFDLPHAREMKKFFVEVYGREPGYVVNSHYNADHTWGNQVFSGSTIIMHKEAPRERLTEDPETNNKLIKYGKDGTVGQQYFYNEFQGFDLTGVEWQDPDILIDSTTTIMLGNMEVQIISVAPAHSDSDLIIWLPKEKVVFCGDLVFERGGAIAYSAQGIKLWGKALDFIIEELKPEIVIPGHGAICDLEEVKLNKEYFEFVLEQFDKHYTDDITAMELCKKIDVDKYKHFLQPERLFININALMNERRSLPNPPNWDYFAETMPELKAFHNEKYGVREWDPFYTWQE